MSKSHYEMLTTLRDAARVAKERTNKEYEQTLFGALEDLAGAELGDADMAAAAFDEPADPAVRIAGIERALDIARQTVSELEAELAGAKGATPS